MNLRLPTTVRSLGRFQHIVRVLTKHGFGHVVDRLRLGRFVPVPHWRRTSPSRVEASLGARLRRVCEDLGPTFVKLGQMISTRPDLFPPEIVNELAKLQDRVPPFPTEEAMAIIADDLGAPVESCFESIDPEPFASGSIAQVYHARTRATDRRPARSVVVKVKRPDIEDTVRLDMTLLRFLTELWVPELGLHDPKVVIDEFERKILREMDFINEAATVARFGELFGKDECFRVPEVFWDLTGPRVLTLERLSGVSAQEMLANPDPRLDRRALAVRLVECFMKQFFEMGLFHADPHPGNLLITPPANVGLIDFGLTGTLDDERMGQLVLLLAGAFHRDPDVVIEVLADMNVMGEGTDRAQLRHDFMELIDKYYGLPLHRFDLQTLFYEVSNLVRRHDVTLPREFVMFGKALVSVGGICLQLDPDLNLVELTRPRIYRLVLERLAPTRFVKSATISGWHLMNVLRNAPSQIRDISRRLALGKWQVTIRHRNLDDLAHEIDKASNRLSFAVIIGCIVLGSSWLLTMSGSQTLLRIPLQLVGIAGYLLAGIMGAWLLFAILRSGKLS